MKNIILSFVLIISGVYSSIAQNEITSSLIWEISGKNVKSPSYIFGTIHLIPKSKFLFPPSLQEKVESSEVLVIEVAGISDQVNAINLLMLDTGNVFNYFSRKQLDSLFSYTSENLGYDESKMRLIFGKMKPFFLTQLLIKDQFGENPESYELKLEQIAKKEKMEIRGLETIEEQMGFIDKISIEKQVEMIMEALRNDSSELQELIEIYLSQDIDKIHDFTTKSNIGSPEFEENMLNNRNNNWIKPIQKIIKKKRSFIAVGSAHLGGPNGIIELLRKKGYTLTPIKL